MADASYRRSERAAACFPPRVCGLVALLAVLAALATAPRPAAAAGRGALMASPNRAGARTLAQDYPSTLTPAECGALIPNCEACRMLFAAGAATRARCTRCALGHAVKNSGGSCMCSPGYWLSDEGCKPCGYGRVCAGAKVTPESAARIPCGTHKNTTTEFARSDRECLVRAGYGWAPGDGATECPQGFYNPGGNTRRCARCATGLTTAAAGATAVAECQAGAGFTRLEGGRVAACLRGQFKDDLGDLPCSDCPDGFTTPPDLPAATAATDCSWVLEGRFAPAGAVLGNDTADLCPLATFRANATAYDGAAGVACDACPANMTTADDGATSDEACVTPPGWGFDAATQQPYLCPLGAFSAGGDREPCTPCGDGTFTTDGPGSAHPDDCKVPAGHGTTRAADGSLSAEPCPVGEFGRGADTYGLDDVACSDCPPFSTTAAEGSTESSQCFMLPGYGHERGGVFEICGYGSYSAGGGMSPCTPCGYGYNTSAADGAPVKGATSQAQCAAAAGFTPLSTGGLKPCVGGFYKDRLGNYPCQRCPAGTTTVAITPAAALSECEACAPGYGSAAGGIDPAAPACAICPSGTYSPGRVVGGAPCEACPKPPGYTGRMASRLGISTPEGCFPEFVAAAWDLLAMADAALTQTAAATAGACEAACGADTACQYFVFWGGDGRCLLRNNLPYSRVDVSDTSKSYVAFEIKAGRYVAYEAHPSDAASLGQPLAAYQTRQEAQAACETSAACAGYKYVHTESADKPWRTFRGALWEGVTGKVRVTGGSIDPWVTAVTAT
ncbi:MAG: hypothetical protein J3K34DRAFT_525137 [Monoraphidium minutum]|nr:MAG: hypothetical protein J3K34DRAFT_525137 [Monoraphidium minutum]